MSYRVLQVPKGGLVPRAILCEAKSLQKNTCDRSVWTMCVDSGHTRNTFSTYPIITPSAVKFLGINNIRNTSITHMV